MHARRPGRGPSIGRFWDTRPKKYGQGVASDDQHTRLQPRLAQLVVADEPGSWASAGFTVSQRSVQFGHVSIALVGRSDHADGGIVSWGFSNLELDDPDIDGISTTHVGEEDRPTNHPNGITALDHVVVMSPDGDRTASSLAAAGFDLRRVRDYVIGNRSMRQTFSWMGDVICELVSPQESDGSGPATIWGLAFTSDDLAGSCDYLGEKCTEAKTAVQPGRRIASLRHKDLGISVPTAILSPHPREPRDRLAQVGSDS